MNTSLSVRFLSQFCPKPLSVRLLVFPCCYPIGVSRTLEDRLTYYYSFHASLPASSIRKPDIQSR